MHQNYQYIYHPISGKKYYLESRKGRQIFVSLANQQRKQIQFAGESPVFPPPSTLEIRESNPLAYDAHDVCSNHNCAPIGNLQEACAPDGALRVNVNPGTL